MMQVDDIPYTITIIFVEKLLELLVFARSDVEKEHVSSSLSRTPSYWHRLLDYIRRELLIALEVTFLVNC